MWRQDALKDVEKWACESHEICVGAYDGSGGDGGGSLGNDAFGDAARELKTEQATGQPGGAAASALRRFVKEEVDAALKDLTMDFEIMESSMVRPPSHPADPQASWHARSSQSSASDSEPAATWLYKFAVPAFLLTEWADQSTEDPDQDARRKGCERCRSW
eukprot:COSAG02_NODE_3654_length_6410_cov_11.576929_7_plen_161_part_00